MKKNTHWITIPDDNSSEKKTTASKKFNHHPTINDVKNKIFFGTAFIVMVVVVFALTAPNTFNSLLGSLFDTSGITQEDMKVSIIPKSTTTSGTSNTTNSTTTTSDTTKSNSTVVPTTTSTSTSSSSSDSSDSLVVKTSATTITPEEKAVSISVTPTATAKDCKKDITCFLAYLKDCTVSKVSVSQKIGDQDFEADLSITGKENNNCLVAVNFTKTPDTTITNTKGSCKVPIGTYTKTVFENSLTNITTASVLLAKDYCTGTAVTNLKTYLATAKKTEDNKKVADSQSQTVTELKKEIEKLQSQRQEDMKAIQDLAKSLKDQQNSAHAAASTITATTPSGSSTTTGSSTSTNNGTTTTTATVQPGFKTNPYKVTMTPQQVLQANLSQGYYSSTPSQASALTGSTTSANVTYVGNKVTVTKATKTPATGPSEMLMITFLITFLSVAGWKFKKIFIV